MRLAQGRRAEARAEARADIEEALTSAKGFFPRYRDGLARFTLSALAEDELLSGRPETARALLESLYDTTAPLDNDVPMLAWAYSDLGQEAWPLSY